MHQTGVLLVLLLDGLSPVNFSLNVSIASGVAAFTRRPDLRDLRLGVGCGQFFNRRCILVKLIVVGLLSDLCCLSNSLCCFAPSVNKEGNGQNHNDKRDSEEHYQNCYALQGRLPGLVEFRYVRESERKNHVVASQIEHRDPVLHDQR